MDTCIAILFRVKSGGYYPVHVGYDTERRAVFAREEVTRKGSPCVLGRLSGLRWLPSDTATASYHKLSSQPGGEYGPVDV